MINLVSGFILVLFSSYDSTTVINNPQNNWAYETLENCKEAGLAVQAQAYVLFVCVPNAYETEKND